jgi:hypothetical protein
MYLACHLDGESMEGYGMCEWVGTPYDAFFFRGVSLVDGLGFE